MFDTRVFSRGIKRKKRKEKYTFQRNFGPRSLERNGDYGTKVIGNHFVTKIPKYVITQKRIKFPLKKLP